MATEILAYKTNDGLIFENEVEANKHEVEKYVIEYFDNNPIYGTNEGCRIDGQEIVEYIQEHSVFITKYLAGKL